MGRVQLKTDIRNQRSQQAIHRLGATYEGVLRRYQRRSDGTVRDTVVFSITAEDWPDVRAQPVRQGVGVRRPGLTPCPCRRRPVAPTLSVHPTCWRAS